MTFGRLLTGIVVAFAIALFGVSESWNLLSKALSPGTQPGGLGGPIISAVAAALLGIWALRINAGINLRNKRLDVILRCDERYDDLYKLRIKLVKASRPGVAPVMDDEHMAYFKRYWSLKSDQFDYWLSGYVDQETISAWMMSTADSLQGGGYGEAALDYRASLDEMRKTHNVVNQRFVELVDFLDVYVRNIDIAHRARKFAVVLHYMRIIEKLNCRVIRQLSRSSFRRLRMPAFADTLLQRSRGSYLAISPENLLSRWFDVVMRFWRMPVLAPWHERSAEWQLETLKRKLEKDYPAVDDAAARDVLRKELEFLRQQTEAGAAFAAPVRQRLHISVWLSSSRWIRRQ